MMIPDAKKHNPDPDYLRGLIDKSGLSHRKAAEILGIDPRTIRTYLAINDVKSKKAAPYTVQYCLEALALAKANTCELCGHHSLEPWLDDGETCPQCKLVQPDRPG